MSRKQEIYLDILEVILPFMRNIQTHSISHRFRYGTFYPETELVHNLPGLLVVAEFTEYDVHWLNTQAKIFYSRGKNPNHAFYERITANIQELFSIVPIALKEKLTWSGPAAAT